MGLELKDLENNPRAKIKIVGPGVLVEAIISSDIGIAGANEFNTPFATSVAAPITDTINKVSALSGALGGTSVANVAKLSQAQTAMFWVGSAKPSFTLQLSFVAVSDKDSIDMMNKVMQLYKTVYPAKISKTVAPGISIAGFSAPLGYRPFSGKDANNKGKPNGTLTIQAGQWFKARKQVMKSVEFTFSKETLKSGRPLYCTGSISFEPFQEIFFSDLEAMINFNKSAG